MSYIRFEKALMTNLQESLTATRGSIMGFLLFLFRR